MEIKKIDDGTNWPNPRDRHFHDIAWALRYNPKALTKSELRQAAMVLEAYEILVTHPAFTLREVTKKISGIRKAIKPSIPQVIIPRIFWIYADDIPATDGGEEGE